MLPLINISIPSYVLLSSIGLCVAILFVYFRMESVGIKFSDLLLYIMFGAVCALVLARVVFVIAIIPSLDKLSFDNIIYYIFNGGIVFYGGLFGLIIGIYIVSRIRNKNVMDVLNCFAPAFPLFHAFARLGCLLAGCCYGIPFSWGVVMSNSHIVRFPVQFFESICNLLIFFVIMIYSKKKNTQENNLKIYLCLYSLCRFVLEFFRGDEVRGIWFGYMSTAQLISVGIIIFYTIKHLVRKKEVVKSGEVIISNVEGVVNNGE